MSKKTIAIALFAVLFLLAQASPAPAQADGFTETFDSEPLKEWEYPPATTLSNGELKITPGGFALHFGDWAEITLQVRVKFSGEEGAALVRYYFREAGRYQVSLSTGQLAVEKFVQDKHTELGSARAPAILQDTWLDVKITVAQEQHQVFINDELLLTATDPEPLETGAVFLGVEGGVTAYFDDLQVNGVPGGGPREQPAQAEPGSQPNPTAVASPQQPVSSQTSWAGLQEEFFASQPSTLELGAFLVNLILAAVCAVILSIVYIYWGASLSNRRKFAANFLLIILTTTFIIMVVRSSVALSLGLVGALSIIRFRTAVKEPEELAYLFFAIGIGIGLGDHQRLLTLVVLAAGIVLLGARHFLQRREADVNLHLTIASRRAGPPAERIELEQIEAALRPFAAKLKLLRLDETPDRLEAGFLLEFRQPDDLAKARAALRSLSETLEFTFMDNKGLF